MKVTHTNRGFEIVEFKDDYDLHCSLQQSSLADFEPPGSSAIWLGIDDRRMHIKYKQVKELNERLTNWLNTGSFKRGR